MSLKLDADFAVKLLAADKIEKILAQFPLCIINGVGEGIPSGLDTG